MKLSGIQPYTAIDQYFKIGSAGSVNAGTSVGNAQNNSNSNTDRDRLAEALEQESARSRQTFSAFDYAKEYDASATYSMKGAEADLDSLDQPAAPAGKDSVLQQYSYFVRPEKAAEQQVDSRQEALENFMLF